VGPKIAALLEELKHAYSEAGLDCGEGLLPPADKVALDLMVCQLGLPLPPEMRDVLLVHGGQKEIGAGVTGLFGAHRLKTPAEVAEHHQLYCETCLHDPLPAFPPLPGQYCSWVPQLIPFADWNADELCIDSVSGEVWEFTPNQLHRHWQSITAVLEEILATVRSGEEPRLRW
jgi:cell wall assembly regulator SMI1